MRTFLSEKIVYYHSSEKSCSKISSIVSEWYIKFYAIPPYFFVNQSFVDLEFNIYPKSHPHTAIILKRDAEFVLKIEGRMRQRDMIWRPKNESAKQVQKVRFEITGTQVNGFDTSFSSEWKMDVDLVQDYFFVSYVCENLSCFGDDPFKLKIRAHLIDFTGASWSTDQEYVLLLQYSK